jgi:hypothetical protein
MSIIFEENTIIIGTNSIYELLASSYEADERAGMDFGEGSEDSILTEIDCRSNTLPSIIITGTAKV